MPASAEQASRSAIVRDFGTQFAQALPRLESGKWTGPIASGFGLHLVRVRAVTTTGKPRFSERVPWLVAFLFGLLHGFGFAGTLKEVGLPEGEVPMALLTFNLGVELGQLAVIVSVFAILAGLRRWLSALEVGVIRSATFAIGVTASFWLIEKFVT